jgi:hemoglobin-like flavoprotein
MAPADVTLVKQSFQKLAPVIDSAVSLFYARLFELDPLLRARFRGDMVDQGHKLAAAAAITVAMLDRVDAVLPFLRELWGNRGVGPLSAFQVARIGEALLWTVERVLAAEFTPEVSRAWTEAYLFIANALALRTASVESMA